MAPPISSRHRDGRGEKGAINFVSLSLSGDLRKGPTAASVPEPASCDPRCTSQSVAPSWTRGSTA